jgi:ABC-type glycerol-3-phosphate transport system substrate-binding protein
MKKLHGIALIGAAALLLAACGSSDNGPATPAAAATDIPASAAQDSAGLLAFVNGQIGASSDTGEPIVIGDAVLPTDETTETSL